VAVGNVAQFLDHFEDIEVLQLLLLKFLLDCSIDPDEVVCSELILQTYSQRL
jgi:hypothetical protein